MVRHGVGTCDEREDEIKLFSFFLEEQNGCMGTHEARRGAAELSSVPPLVFLLKINKSAGIRGTHNHALTARKTNTHNKYKHRMTASDCSCKCNLINTHRRYPKNTHVYPHFQTHKNTQNTLPVGAGH